MKLSQLRPCDNCDGAVGQCFQLIRTSLVMVNPNIANQVLGMAQILGGDLRLAEVMADSGGAVTVAGDAEPKLMSEIFLCHKCYATTFGKLAALIERRNESESVLATEAEAAQSKE